MWHNAILGILLYNFVVFHSEDGRTDLKPSPSQLLTNFSVVLTFMKHVDVLKKGLSKLRDQIRDRKAKLDSELKAGRPISEADQDWLDHGDGNLVDKERVVDTLENAPDYEQGLEGLSSQDKLVVEKLQKLAGKGGNVPLKKRKRTFFIMIPACWPVD